jgi:hypothetical protein
MLLQYYRTHAVMTFGEAFGGSEDSAIYVIDVETREYRSSEDRVIVGEHEGL